MNRLLIVALSFLLSILPFGCDDKEKDEPCDCAPVAGEVVAGEEAGEEVQAGEEEVPAGEETDMEVPVEAGEESPDEMDMEIPEEDPEAGAEG